DKATMDFESYQDGTLLYIGPKEGEAVPIDAVIAVLGEEGEDYKSLLEEEGGDGAGEGKADSEDKDKADSKGKEDNSKKEDDSEKDKKEESSDSGDSNVTAEDLGVTVITMPLLSDTMTEGVIAEWNFKVGDEIKSDDAIADVETDKATMEVTAYAEGTLLYIGLEKGEAAKVNDIIAIVGRKGTDITPLLNQKDSAGKEQKPDADADADAEKAPGSSKSSAEKADSTADSPKEDSNSADGRIKASPLARKMAKEKGIDLKDVKGSADGGRIVKRDIEEFKPKAAAAAPQGEATGEKKTISIPQYIGEE